MDTVWWQWMLDSATQEKILHRFISFNRLLHYPHPITQLGRFLVHTRLYCSCVRLYCCLIFAEAPTPHNYKIKKKICKRIFCIIFSHTWWNRAPIPGSTINDEKCYLFIHLIH